MPSSAEHCRVDDIIGVFTINPLGPNASRPMFQTSISEAGIHSIDFAVVANPHSVHALAQVDDFSFGHPTAATGS
jgi:hypothetical protein